MGFWIQPVGDSAIKVLFTEEVSEQLSNTIQAFCKTLADTEIKGVTEWVPAYNSVTIYYQPIHISFLKLKTTVKQIFDRLAVQDAVTFRIVKVPVLYGEKYGPDIERIATFHNLTTDEVIQVHQQPDYLIYMLGFLPGFPYLGGLDKRIATPRLDEPRSLVEAGSVGIAHEQTGIYPVSSPGGWNIIGKSPLRLFDPENEFMPFLFKPGDRIRFYAITAKEYEDIHHQVMAGTYSPSIEEVKR